MLFLGYRLTPQTQFSAPFLEGRMVIFTARKDRKNSIREALAVLSQPFKSGGWALIALMLIFFAGVFVVTAFVFSPTMSFRGAFTRLFDDRDEPHDTLPHEERSRHRLLEKFTWRSLSTSVKVFLAVLVLLYEIAVAVHIFKQGNLDFPMAYGKIHKDELHKYVTIRGGASEYVFWWRVGAKVNNTKDMTSWSRAQDTDEMIDWVLSPKHPAVYGISYDVSIALLLILVKQPVSLLFFLITDKIFCASRQIFRITSVSSLQKEIFVTRSQSCDSKLLSTSTLAAFTIVRVFQRKLDDKSTLEF